MAAPLSIQMNFKNLSTNTQARIEISTAGVVWSFGAPGTSSGGITVTASSASIPLSSLEINNQNLFMTTQAAGGGGGGLVNFNLSLFLDPGLATGLKGEATLNPECQIEVSIDNQQQETWASGPITYIWS